MNYLKIMLIEKSNKENELPQQENVQEPEELGQESADTCTSTLTLFRVILCLMLLYEYHFDFIDHLPIHSCSHRLVLAVIYRVQSSLIILSMYLLHTKIVSSLIFTFNSANVESDFALTTLQQYKDLLNHYQRSKIIYKACC